MINNATITTKGSGPAAGYARIESTFHIDDEILAKINAAAIKKVKDDDRISADNIINPVVCNINIVKPYFDSGYNIRCNVSIGAGWYVDIDLNNYNIDFELRCACE